MYDDYMNTKETATFLKVSKTTVEKWRKKGWLMPDVIGHGKNGHHNVFYYSRERILQLASVYLNNDANRTQTSMTQNEYEDNLTHTVRVLASNKQARFEMALKFLNLLFGAVVERVFGYLWTKQDKATYLLW